MKKVLCILLCLFLTSTWNVGWAEAAIGDTFDQFFRPIATADSLAKWDFLHKKHPDTLSMIQEPLHLYVEQEGISMQLKEVLCTSEFCAVNVQFEVTAEKGIIRPEETLYAVDQMYTPLDFYTVPVFFCEAIPHRTENVDLGECDVYISEDNRVMNVFNVYYIDADESAEDVALIFALRCKFYQDGRLQEYPTLSISYPVALHEGS